MLPTHIWSRWLRAASASPTLLLAATLLLASSTLLACSTGDTPAPFDVGVDTRPADTRPADTLPADTLPADTLPADTLPADTLPADTLSPDLGPCGNGQLENGEDCDPGIPAGDPGACPQDCDDKNPCTDDKLLGTAADCDARCEHTPLKPCCGNGLKEAGEVCDDGNQVGNDGCTKTCTLPGGHLLITEVATSPSEAEFIEIYNPSNAPTTLKDVYLSDRVDYFQIVDTAAFSGVSTDFVVRFPAGAVLNPGAYAVIATNGFKYKIAYGKAPDYEITSSDGAVPDMVPANPKALGSQAGLTDTGELLVLFTWDGASDLVQDLDYVVWKGSSATAFAKSPALCIDGPDADSTPSCYLADTAVTQQSALKVPQQGGSLHRCDYTEAGEKQTGGNGATGHDETSEPFDSATAPTWKRNPNTLKWRTPGEPAPPTFCPQ
jgi:cysteine-rich repeat protein